MLSLMMVTHGTSSLIRYALWNIPFGPMSEHKYFCMSMFHSVCATFVAESLPIPEALYEKSDFKFQRGCDPSAIASRFDESPCTQKV
jgi:hypothetical protein